MALALILSCFSIEVFAESGADKKPNTLSEYIEEYRKTGEDYSKVHFTRSNKIILCSTIKARGQHEKLIIQIEKMRQRTGISKDFWNNVVVHKLQCRSESVLRHALLSHPNDFIALADYGANLELEFRDFDGDISTVKDFSQYQLRKTKGAKRIKWSKVVRYILQHKVKGCKDLPHIKCTAPYIKYD